MLILDSPKLTARQRPGGLSLEISAEMQTKQFTAITADSQAVLTTEPLVRRGLSIKGECRRL
jgi:hypothetical protein